jgi:hypothetical protein
MKKVLKTVIISFVSSLLLGIPSAYVLVVHPTPT